MARAVFFPCRHVIDTADNVIGIADNVPRKAASRIIIARASSPSATIARRVNLRLALIHSASHPRARSSRLKSHPCVCVCVCCSLVCVWLSLSLLVSSTVRDPKQESAPLLGQTVRESRALLLQLAATVAFQQHGFSSVIISASQLQIFTQLHTLSRSSDPLSTCA
eukprot:20781-Rhodomonas_salina.2